MGWEGGGAVGLSGKWPSENKESELRVPLGAQKWHFRVLSDIQTSCASLRCAEFKLQLKLCACRKKSKKN